MKKRLITAFLAVLGLYIAVSIVLSCLISIPVEGVDKWDIIMNRRPFLLIECMQTTVIKEDNRPCAYNSFGEYIGHSRDSYPGDEVFTVFIYNPFTWYADDIAIRFDHDTTENFFSINYWW